jgi:hypothetical protein
MGATYTRQSTYTDGDVIQASDTNNEFNQLLAAFAASTGHTHDGTTAEGGPITKLLGTSITIGDGTAGTDIAVTFDGETSDGVLTWMEDEDHFKFSDDIVIDSTKKLYLNDAGGEHISGDATDLTIASGNDINLTATTDINIPANVGLTFGNDAEKIEGDGTDLTVSGNNINLTAVADVNIPSGVGLTFATAEKIESDGTDLSITVGSGGDINIPADIGLTFGDDGEKIEGDGTDLTITGNNINLTATADVVVPADVGITFGSGEKIEGDNTDLTITSGAKINLTATSDVHIPNNVGVVFGGDSEKIEGDGTDMTISANNLTVDAVADITLDAGGANVVFKDDGTSILDIANNSGDAELTVSTADKNFAIKGTDGSSAITALDIDMALAGKATFSGDVVVTGDLTVTGDDLTMGTNTSGHIMVADGTNFNPVAVSGDVTIASNGAVTIANGAVETAMVNANVITGQTEITSSDVDITNDDVLIHDNSASALRKVSVTNLISSAGGLTEVLADTSPQLGGNLDTNSHNILIDDAHFIADENGNEQIIFQTTASAVNQIDVTNAATGNAPEISATGGDTNISLKLTPKGSGQVLLDGNVGIESGTIDLKNSGSRSKINFYCESGNAHAQALQAAPHSESASNTLTLPSTGGDVDLVSTASTATLTNKTLTSPKINEDVALTATATELNLLDGVSGLAQADFTKLAAVDSTATELNIVDGDTSVGTTAVAGGDGIVTNDNGTMRQTSVDTFDTYLSATTKTLTNKTLTTPTLTTPIANAGIQLKNGSTSAGFLEFFEDSDNGTNKVTLIGPSSTSDITLTLPSSAGTVATTASAADEATALAIALG